MLAGSVIAPLLVYGSPGDQVHTPVTARLLLGSLQSYAASYTSMGKILRLLHIAKATPGTHLELEALKLAADQLKQART